jgi:hypothetical protein
MSAKEERAMQLEMHKMTRKCSELVAKHAASEAECNRLRWVIAQESEKHAATHAAAVRQFNSAIELERGKITALQCHLEAERGRMMEQLQKESVAQRQSNADALGAIKRTLDVQFTSKMNELTRAMEQSMQQVAEERQRIKCDAAEQRAQLDTEREQMHRQLNEARERIKRDEHEQLRQFAFRMDSERAQLQKERALMAEQAVKERQANDAACGILERQLKAQHAAKMNELTRATDSERAQLQKERALMAEQAVKERQANDAACGILERQLKAQHAAKMNELTRAMEQLNGDEREQRAQLIKERERIDRHEQAQIARSNEDARAFNALKKQLKDAHVEKMNEFAAAYDAAVQKMNEEREQDKRQLIEEREQLGRQLVEERDKINRNLLDHVRDIIASNHAHMQLICNLDLKGKRVVVYSHYSEHNEVESYNLLAIECIEHYFDCIIILTNCPNKWTMHSQNYNKCHLLGYNMKSDFRNYGVFLMQTANTLIHASRLCLMNDSFVIVDVNAFGNCIKPLFENEKMSHDFVGLTSSHEGVFHLQSYFMCFDAPTIPAILSYFETRGLPMNHQTAISTYELGITAHLINGGFSPFAVVSNDDMRVPMNTTCCKWAAVLQHIGIIKRQHLLKLYPRKLAMTDANIAMVAKTHSYNKHFIDFLRYNRIDVLPA